MAKGSYVGVGGQIVKGDIIPKTWAGSKSPYTSNGIVLSASGEYSGYPAIYACDGDTTNFYRDSGVTESWLKLAFPTPRKISKMKTWVSALSASKFSNAVIQGSNDDNNWDSLYTITSAQTALTVITLNNPDYYKYYRIYAISTDASRPPIIYEWQVSEYTQNPVARKVKKAYAGVAKIARKVKKGYIGVAGVAQLFYSSETLVPFTSNPAPTTWTEITANTDYEASNMYGVWYAKTIYAPTANQTAVSRAFDASTSTYWSATSTTNTAEREAQLWLPQGVSINPTKITIIHQYVGRSALQGKVQGSVDGTDWVDLCTLTVSTNKTTETFDITTETFYKYFRVLTYRYSSSSNTQYVYDFQITAGTLKTE